MVPARHHSYVGCRQEVDRVSTGTNRIFKLNQSLSHLDYSTDPYKFYINGKGRASATQTCCQFLGFWDLDKFHHRRYTWKAKDLKRLHPARWKVPQTKQHNAYYKIIEPFSHIWISNFRKFGAQKVCAKGVRGVRICPPSARSCKVFCLLNLL